MARFLAALCSCFSQHAPEPKAEKAPGDALHEGLIAICGKDFVAFEGGDSYGTWLTSYNRDKPMLATPHAIVRPRTAKEVADVVKLAASASCKVQPKSGGHSFANFCFGGPGSTNTITVDLFEMQHVKIDPATQHALVGGGALLGKLTESLHEQGGRAFAHGICPGVGIGGHATIGGLGPMSRMWGSSLDHVVEVEVVTADGRIVTANQEENSDLFFGIRGAGASFGIVTQFTLRTHPEPGEVVQYSYQFTFGEHDVAGTFKTWQALVFDAALDRRLGTMFIIAGDMAVVEAIFYGSEAEYRASPLHGRLPTPTKQDVKINGWLGHLAHMAEDELLPVSNVGVPFRSKTLGLRAQDRLSDELVDDLIAYLRHAPRGGADLNVIVFDAQGGATNDVATRATSYGHRDKVMFYQNYLVQLGGVDEKNVTFSSDLLELVSRALGAPEPIASTYAGYVDLDLGVGAKAGPTYWGENYPALQALKKKWDPRDVFHNPQSVVPA